MTADEIEEEIRRIDAELTAGTDAWEQGTDCFAMASCDPSDHYILEVKREELVQELKKLTQPAG